MTISRSEKRAIHKFRDELEREENFSTNDSALAQVFQAVRGQPIPSNARNSLRERAGLEPPPKQHKKRRLPKASRIKASIGTKAAARRMEKFVDEKFLGNMQKFATLAKTTDRTLRKFRATGRVKRSILYDIAKAMKIEPEELLSS